jgi:hypothetical protein
MAILLINANVNNVSATGVEVTLSSLNMSGMVRVFNQNFTLEDAIWVLRLCSA